MQEELINLRMTQLHLLYCGLGLEEPTDDIATDVACVGSLMGELSALDSITRSRSGFGLVTKVQEALGLDSLDSIPMPLQRSLEGLERIVTQDLAMSRFNTDHFSPTRIVSPPPKLSLHELICSMHSLNPHSPTTLCKGPGQGPWFSRASSVDNNRDGVEFKGHERTSIKTEVTSDVVEHEVRTLAIANVYPTTRDMSLDDVLAKTTAKRDER